MALEEAGRNGWLTKRTLIAVAGASVVVVLLVWQLAQVLLLVFASLLLACWPPSWILSPISGH